MPSGDKQHPVSLKKVPLRELPKEPTNIIARSSESSPLYKDRATASNASRLNGTKRQQPDPVQSENGHLVYVRRKLDAEPSKTDGQDQPSKTDGSDPPKLRKDGDGDEMDPAQMPKITPSPVLEQFRMAGRSVPALCKELPLMASSDDETTVGSEAIEPKIVATNGNSGGVDFQSSSGLDWSQVDFQSSSGLDWKGRFLRLQMFLQNCDTASQEVYIKKLRSLSAAGRSKHAVELERRAMHLLREEGKVLHLTRALNILEKASLKDNSTEPPTPFQAQYRRDEKAVDTLKLSF